MFEILMYLFESYFDAGAYPAVDKLSRKLAAAGFEDDEISEAITWIAAMQDGNAATYASEFTYAGLRHFGAPELHAISAEARQFLISTHQHGLISKVELEMVIDRAVALQQRQLSVDKLKLVTLMVLWNRQRELDPLLIEELLTPLVTAQIH
ncbi:MAG: DUF494 domain-containing protein [Gallionella sp.]